MGDKIDILIELGGLFRGNSLDALVYKPAPVQVTYVGYSATTGLQAIDYRIVDSHTDPAGYPYSAQEFATEKLERLDSVFCAACRGRGPFPCRHGRASGREARSHSGASTRCRRPTSSSFGCD